VEQIATSMLFATIVAGTPLIITALGELVTEKSGVLNLGAEGIMAVGAVAGFAVAHDSGSTTQAYSPAWPPAQRCRSSSPS
jgi:simple sugar transport system permease protein